MHIRQEDDEEPPLYAVGDLVWLQNRRRRKGENPKLQPKFVGPYEVLAAWGNHTYRIERQGQESVQHESRLKPYRACTEPVGQAPGTMEATRRPNMKGAVPRARRRATTPELDEEFTLLQPRERPREEDITPRENREVEESPPQEVDDPQARGNSPAPVEELGPPGPSSPPRRSQRTRNPPQRYGEFYCHTLGQPKIAEKIISQDSAAQTILMTSLSNTTSQESKNPEKDASGAKEKIAEARTSVWSVVGPTNYPLSEEEWPQLPGKNCQERNKLITCQRKTDEPVGAEKQKWVEQTAAAIPIRVAASDLAVSSSAGSRAANQAGITTATTGNNLCKLGKKIDTTGSSEEKVPTRIAKSAPPQGRVRRFWGRGYRRK